MLIDCDTCIAPEIAADHACDDCVVSVLLGTTRAPRASLGTTRRRVPVEFDEAEQHAIDVLAAAGLVPPVRLVPVFSGNEREIA